jgi:outer membrane protein assembly factor BamA
VIAAILLGLALGSAGQAPAEVVAQIQVHGNMLTPEDEVVRLADVRVGMPFDPATIETVTARLRATKRFASVEVLKRYASIADPSQIILVIMVDDGRVEVDWSTGEVKSQGGRPGREGPHLMFLPILNYEDGYGFTYGVRFALPDLLGPRSRLSVPLSLGAEKLAGVELEKNFDRGPFTRVLGGGSVSRRENPFFDANEDRRRVFLQGDKQFVRPLRASVRTGWDRQSFGGRIDTYPSVGGEVAFDTRLDPVLTRNAVFARASWDRLFFDGRDALDRTELEARGYVGLFGSQVLVVRALREDASGPQPPYLKSLMGGMSTLRGFKAGSDIGDTLVAGSVEWQVPLTSPLNVGKLGVSAFVDIATVYDDGQRLSHQQFDQGAGGSVWFSAAIFRLTLAVAHGIGEGTRVHFGTGVSF